MSDARRQDDRCDFPDRLKPRARLRDGRHPEQLEAALGVAGRSLGAAGSRSCKEEMKTGFIRLDRMAHATAASDEWSGGGSALGRCADRRARWKATALGNGLAILILPLGAHADNFSKAYYYSRTDQNVSPKLDTGLLVDVADPPDRVRAVVSYQQ